MNKKAYLKERRKAIRDSIRYFDTNNIDERDRWVCAELLANFGEEFREEELVRPQSDPPDAEFRGARFEVKEILDPGRRRHDEYKAALARAEAASDPAKLLTSYTPKDIDPAGIAGLVKARLEQLSLKYEPAFQRTLDLVLYVNLMEHGLRVGPMPPPADFVQCGWRSVSVVCGWGGLVFHVEDDAPEFLRRRVGAVTLRRFE